MSFQLVHGPSTKTRVAYILSLLHQPADNSNESTVMEDEESDIEDGDITMLNTEVMHSALTGQPDTSEIGLVVVQEYFSVPAVPTLTVRLHLGLAAGHRCLEERGAAPAGRERDS